MRSATCGQCRRPITAPAHAIPFDITTMAGTVVSVMLHETCSPILQGRIAYLMRQNAIERRTKLDVNALQVQSLEWTPTLIRAVRIRLGLTQAEFAKRLGYNRQSVYLHERPGSEPWQGIGGQMCQLEREACLLTGLTLMEWLDIEEHRYLPKNRLLSAAAS